MEHEQPYLIPQERRCFCGANSDPNPQTSDHTREVNGWTVAFCYERCARQFDEEVARRQSPQLYLVAL